MTSLPTLEPSEADALLGELLLTPEGRADPYPRYARLREELPIFRSVLGMWVVSRYDDCMTVLRDPRFAKREDADGAPGAAVTAFTEAQFAQLTTFTPDRRPMLMLNPPDHTRLRGLVSKAFTPRTVEALRPHIVRLTDDILDTWEPTETVDVMTTLAFPLPVTVIGEMLGIPVADRASFQTLVRTVTKTLEPMVTFEEMLAADAAQAEMEAYFGALANERRKDLGDDLLSALIRAEDEGDRLTEIELLTTVILLFAAGFETTTNLIGNGLLALLTHPDQLDRLRADPAGIARSATEELVRFDSPVQLDGRSCIGSVEIAGATIGAGDDVFTLLGAANRDPRHFADPDRLDLGRDEGPPMSFGSGIHYCLGAALARAEGQVVFGRLVERFPAIALASGAQPAYRDSLTLRGLSELHVTLA